MLSQTLTSLGLTLILLLGLAGLPAVSLATSLQEWPWSSRAEPFPWLEYLKSLNREKEGVTLYIITRHESTILTKAKELFLKSPVARELGIKDIVPLYVGPELWEDYIRKAAEAGTPIDIAWGGGPTLFNYIDEKGYIAVVDPSENPAYYAILYEASKIPETIAGAPTKRVDERGRIHWIGSAISSFGFTINHNVLKQYGVPAPEKWMDLANPDYAVHLPSTPLVGIADPTKSTSHTRIFEIILQAYGWEEGWRTLTLMAANSKIYDSSSSVRDGVIRGEIAIGITIDFYGYTAMHQNPSCKYVIPSNESIVNADPIAVLAGTKHPVQAAAFVAWVLSEHGGQQIWLDMNINRLPINSLVFNTTTGQTRPDLEKAYKEATGAGVIEFNETRALSWEKAMQAYFKATLVNTHDVLQSVWASLVKAYKNGQITSSDYNYLVNKLTALVNFTDPLTGKETIFSEDYASKINPYLEKGAVYNQLVNAWEDAALKKYQQVYEELQRIIATRKTTTTPVEPTPSKELTSAPTTTPTAPQPSRVDITAIAVALVAIAMLVVAVYMLARRR